MTICLYLSTAFEKTRRRSAEGGLKYFVYGSVSSALFLFGLSLIYGLTGTTQFDAIRQALASVDRATSTGLAGNVAGATAVLLMLVGFGFKVAAVPFHQWAPDAYEGAPAPVTAWIATGSKIASFVALMKVCCTPSGPGRSPSNELMGPGWIGRGRGARGRDDDLRQLRRAGPAEPQADARLLVDRPRRLHAGGVAAAGVSTVASRGGRLGPLLPGRLRLQQPRGLRRGRLAGPRQGDATTSTTSTAWASSYPGLAICILC